MQRRNRRLVAACRALLGRHRRAMRRAGLGCGIFAAVLLTAFAGLWWRLSSGPIPLDVFTPWLASAIAQNFGNDDTVAVGGTQIERTENGGAAVRIRDIVVRDPAGEVVARAPKAEVRVSALSLLTGHIRAESLNLVGAQLKVRIAPDGKVTVYAGADQQPIATANARLAAALARQSNLPPPADAAPAAAADTPATAMTALDSPAHLYGALGALLAWIDGIGQSGLDGHDLGELGLKEGTLTVDDGRSGTDWSLSNITLSLARPRDGGVALRLGSENPTRPWSLVAAVKPAVDGVRSIEIDASRVPANGVLRALHLGDGSMAATLPLSGSVRSRVGDDGVPRSFAGHLDVGAGSLGAADSHIAVESASFKLDWDGAARALNMPFQIMASGNRITLLAQLQAPAAADGNWSFKLSGGSVVLAAPAGGAPLILRRIALGGSYDPARRRLVLADGTLGNADVSVSMSGKLAYTAGRWMANAGLAARRMSAAQLKQLWPFPVAPKVRDWFIAHLSAGTVDHVTVAVNAPFDTLVAGGPPIPDDGLTIEAAASDCVVEPVPGMPPLANADLAVHVVGRDAKVAVGHAVATLPSGRTLALSSGTFEVPDSAPRQPPARVSFQLDSTVAAAAELLDSDQLRDIAKVPFDPATTHGTLSAHVALAMRLAPKMPPGSTNYAVTLDASNFSADRVLMGQRLDAPVLHGTATPQGFQLAGQVVIAGSPASLDYRQVAGERDAELRLAGSLDAAARKVLGFDRDNTISGAIPVRLAGRVSAADRQGRFNIAVDLTAAQIEDFLPGWVKPAGKPAHASLTLTTSPQAIAIDDLKITGAGEAVAGSIDLDASGQLRSADFPSYGFSSGDQASLKVERGADGDLHVTLRGDAYDGRGFLKSLSGGQNSGSGGPKGASGAPNGRPQAAPAADPDVALDVRLGSMTASNGEALGDVRFKMARRAGEIRSLSLTARIGGDGKLEGGLRGEPGGRALVELHTTDAGALLRATDVYKRMVGGDMAITMEAPSARTTTQQGRILVRNFTIHDEAELQRAAQSPKAGNNLQFSSMRADFTRAPGRILLRDGLARGPLLGGTMDGVVDYGRGKVDLRGTLVPLYGANTLFGWLPVVGPILGGSKEGLVGFTYQVVGKPGNPVLDVNLLSVLAPGVLRKIFEYRATDTLDQFGP